MSDVLSTATFGTVSYTTVSTCIAVGACAVTDTCTAVDVSAAIDASTTVGSTCTTVDAIANIAVCGIAYVAVGRCTGGRNCGGTTASHVACATDRSCDLVVATTAIVTISIATTTILMISVVSTVCYIVVGSAAVAVFMTLAVVVVSVTTSVIVVMVVAVAVIVVVTVVAAVPTVAHAVVVVALNVWAIVVVMMLVVAATAVHSPAMASTVCDVEVGTAIVEVVAMGVAGVDTEVPVAGVPVERTEKVGGGTEGIPLPAVENIADVGIAALPVRAKHVVLTGDSHQIVEVNLVSGLILCVGQIKLVCHLVGQEQCFVAGLFIAHGTCLCRYREQGYQ